MKIGDIVTMRHALTPERYGLGLIQKIISARPTQWHEERKTYHILWPDDTISCQYENEIVLMGATE